MKNYTLPLIGLMTFIFIGNSYLYAQDCSPISVVVSSGTQDDEIGWNIAQSNGWAILSGSVGTSNGCIQDGCWTFNMYDGGGDGWGGSMITISSEDDILFSGTLNSGNYEVNYIQIGDSEPCEEPIYGCEYEGELYSFGSTIQQDCNSCYCEAGFNPEANGFWGCTEMDCGGCTDQYGYHENGSTWSPSPCQIFECFEGYIAEIIIDCPQWEGIPCNGTWVLEDGECCAECIETSNSYCDSISINPISPLSTINEVIQVEMQTFYTSSTYIPYSGFLLMNNEGDTIALETIGTAGNVYGIGPNMSEIRTLYVVDNIEMPFVGELCLVEGLFAGIPNIVCSYPISFSSPISGCTDEDASNYNPEATVDDSSCLYEYNSDCENISITLSNGWNMIGFACTNNTDASVAFEPIQNNIIIAKDAIGNAYLPDWDFNGIGDLERGYGYLIKVNETIENYNICEEL